MKIGKVIREGDLIGIELSPAAGGSPVRVMIGKEGLGEWPVQFCTATTDMKDFIGNVSSIGGGKCSVRGVYRGRDREVRGVTVASPDVKKVGDRVMVTEHVGVDGKFGFLATKRRILKGDLNFACVGWSNEERCRYVRVDVYTGNHVEVSGPPVTMMAWK